MRSCDCAGKERAVRDNEGADPAAFCGGWKKNDTGGRGTTDRRSGVLYAGNDGGAEIPYAARVAKIGKGCEKISGDNFSMLELPGGKMG